MPSQRCTDGVWREIAEQAREYADHRLTGYQVEVIAALSHDSRALRLQAHSLRRARSWQDFVAHRPSRIA